MGVTRFPSTLNGGVTPVCSSCGISIGWDVYDLDYRLLRGFWDSWVCPECNEGQDMDLKAWHKKSNFYAGLGAQSAPDDVLALIAKLAVRLEANGFVLRSCGSSRAADAFEQAATKKEVLLRDPSKEAIEMASLYHPSWDVVSPKDQMGQANNCHQILGENLDSPVRFVLCWTEDGCESGDSRSKRTGPTGQAIAIASQYEIPVFNLRKKNAIERLAALVKGQKNN